jgi:hypothetical protein
MVIQAVELVGPVVAERSPLGCSGRIFPDRSRNNPDADHDRHFTLGDEVVEHGALIRAKAIEFDQEAGWLRRIILGGYVDHKTVFRARIDSRIGDCALEEFAVRNVGVGLAVIGRERAREFALDLLYQRIWINRTRRLRKDDRKRDEKKGGRQC